MPEVIKVLQRDVAKERKLVEAGCGTNARGPLYVTRRFLTRGEVPTAIAQRGQINA